MSAITSRVFMNGNSQAVRIPQEFRLDAQRVQISRNEHGDLVIRAIPSQRGSALLQALQGFDDELSEDFVSRLTENRREQPAVQERDAL